MQHRSCCYDASMRTTVTLEPDLAARVRSVARERGISFKAAINAIVRAGLAADLATGQPYTERPRELGLLPGIDLTKALDLAARLEDEETIRQLEARR